MYFFKKYLDKLNKKDIIVLLQNFGELCNGSTTDSDSVCWGSNPYSPAKKKALTLWLVFSFLFNKIKMGFEQGGSKAEENSPGDCFRRRG